MCKSFTFGCMSIKKIIFIACDPKMCSEINFDKLKTPSSHTLATNLKKSTYKKNQVTNMEPYEKTIAFSKSPEHCLKNRNNEPQTEKIWTSQMCLFMCNKHNVCIWSLSNSGPRIASHSKKCCFNKVTLIFFDGRQTTFFCLAKALLKCQTTLMTKTDLVTFSLIF